ncbi:hypothetical protein F5X98DRAFT_307573 [Xylaria grammica]|nr:hypothetical protein F5X98DRAFT_307573 [Xylaria grammica]
MGKSWQHPPGLVLRTTPQLHPRATHFSDEDDEINFATSTVEPNLPSTSDPGLILKQDHSKDDTRGTCAAREHNSDHLCPSLKESVRVPIEFDSKKRKSPTGTAFLPAKKARLEEGAGRHAQYPGGWLLPAEIWHNIFTFLPPKMLGRLLSVSKCFNSFLNPSSNYACDVQLSLLGASLSPLKPEVIWQLSRRRFWPTMPNPLRDHTELQMWQLACQSECQFCGRTGQFAPPVTYDPSSGPQPIWSFGLRSCDSCLLDRTTKEVDLLLSSVPSCLIPALPFIFINDKMHTISPAMLLTEQATLGLPITKVFLSSHVAAILEEFTSVKAMGKATAEEWLKGLEGRGKERRADSLRWEKFEMSGGLVRIRQTLSSDNILANSKNKGTIKAQSVEKRGNPLDQPGNLGSSGSAPDSPTASFSRPRQNSCARLAPENQIYPQTNILRSKTREEAEEMKAARRAEIEKRAAKLEPPILAHVLPLIPSFHAAIQLTSPLDEIAWNLLKPRLIAQREEIDHGLYRKQEASAHSQASLKRSDDLEGSQRITLEAKQKVDKTWDDAQAPLRARISFLADQFIHDSWGNGRRVNKESSPRFAAEVLLYVRRRFYSDMEKEDAATRAAGRAPPREAPNGPYTRKLTLENMRWLFDVKIKPLTEAYRRELFYCHGCEPNTKLYGFEGVVQHYAAKHTNRLSLGSIVVHWRAEWPEVPPFHPEPRHSKKQRTGVPKHKPNEELVPIPPTPPVQPFHQGEPIPDFRQPMPHIQYDSVPIQALHGQFAPYMGPVPEYAHPFQDQAAQDPSNPFLNDTPYHEPPGGFHGGDLYGPVQATNVSVYQGHSYVPYQDHGLPELQSSYDVQSLDIHHEKLEDIARNSSELWFSIAPVKQLPGPVRIFVVLHHVSARFRTRFSEKPSLILFMEGLSKSKEMRPIRSINGLQCRACCFGLGLTTAADQDKDSYSLPQLVKHFYERHFQQLHAIGAPVLDWSTDMIHLPDRILSNLGNLTNIDDRKLALIHSALSEAAASNSQLHASRSADASLLLDHEIPNRRRHSSSKRAPAHKSHPRHNEAVQEANKRRLETRNVDKAIPGTSRPNSNSIDADDSGIMRKPSKRKADHRSTGQAPVDNKATTNTNSSTKPPLAKQSSHLIQLPQSRDWESPKDAENDDDDGFDLIAGLESQLDRQASSSGPSNPLGLNN